MNYFVTHCDKNFLKHAERLFESLKLFSDYKIIFYTIDFDYKNKFDNVIPQRLNSDNFTSALYKKSSNFVDKAFFVFLKPIIVLEVLKDFRNENRFCYIDADCIARHDCDLIFGKFENISYYPLLNLGCQEFMLHSGRGNPFTTNGVDLSLCLEAPLLNELGLDVNIRTASYLQTGVFIFDEKCSHFLEEWKKLCYSDLILENWQYLTPFHEETVINCLLWKIKNVQSLDRVLINIPEEIGDVDLMLKKLDNPKDSLERITSFCTIPSKGSMKNLHFFHGKCSDSVYNKMKENMKQFYLLIHSSSLGDTLAATPTLRKLSFVYESKINVVTHVPELFKNNPYVNKTFSFDDLRTLNLKKSAKEVFETFVDIGGKNKRGIEKKHSTIDIRQFHALDLGFCLSESEMEYDFIPEESEAIDDLPEDYIALHVGSTWPSRTYEKKNWEELTKTLTSKNIPVVLVGKNSHERGFFEIDKKTIDINVNLGIDLTNKLTLSQCWNVINKAKAFVTMDSGLLHLAGTTDTNIIQLGSSINNKLRAPFRKNSQSYKYDYISGSCEAFCASDIKYGIKEWGTIQGVPPLINCLEDRSSFDCHPPVKNVVDCIEKIITPSKSKKILFLAPHLSTGGSPAYLLWLINKRKSQGYDVKVVEYCYYGDYVVHRNCIIDLVGEQNFLSFGHLRQSDEQYDEKSQKLIDFIKDYNPDEIHLNELAEIFSLKKLTDDIKNFLYDENRSFKILETCHTSEFDFNDKKLIPDAFHFCSSFHKNLCNLNVSSKLVDMKVEKKVKPDRTSSLIKLGLNPNYYHVLNVALFHSNKNQKFLYELASQLKNQDVQFHFIGNTCFYNDCGLTEEMKALPNCVVHDERDNVGDYMAAMDLFVLPSHKELNPISIKEALSWNMPCFISDIETLRSEYKNEELINFINGDNLKSYILDNMDKAHNVQIKTFALPDKNIFNATFNPKPKIEISGSDQFDYEVSFVKEKDNFIVYRTTINNGMWAGCDEINEQVKIIVKNLSTKVKHEFYNTVENDILPSPENTVDIVNESGSLGDCIAWVPMVQRYAELNKTKVNFYSPHKQIFNKDKYDLINFFDYNQKPESKDSIVELHYDIPTSHNNSLQEVACKILDIPYEEEKTVLIEKSRPSSFSKKYVCIATQSTAQAKYWNNKNGWKKVVNYLKFLGYDVVCIDKHKTFGIKGNQNTIPSDCIDKTGDISLQDRIDDLYNCEFFIGLGSGLSWLAWACQKPVVMISGFSKPYAEFTSPYRVINEKVCNGCWNNDSFQFEPSNWLWCPENKNFECTKEISFEMVKNKINLLRKENNL